VKLVKSLPETIQATKHGSRMEHCEVRDQDPWPKNTDLANELDVILQENAAIMQKHREILTTSQTCS
jgi:hypothetical protein